MRSSRRRVRRAAGAAGAATLIALTGVSVAAGTPASAADEGNQVIKVAYSSTIDSFNPFIAVYQGPFEINGLVYEHLVTTTAKDYSLTPGLATSWDASDGGKTWTFHIRKGMTWSDGKPITSADARWTYTQMLTNEAMSQANGSLVTNFKQVLAPDPHTLVIKMKSPTAVNPGVTIPIVPKHVWGKLKNPATFANDKDVVGSGPYVLESYEPSQQVVLKANPHFWRGRPKLDGVTYVNFKNTDAAVQALKSGDIDVIGDLGGGLTVPQFNALKAQKNITLNSAKGTRFVGLGVNPGATTRDGTPMGDGNPVLKDPVVRRAIRQAINIPALMKTMLQGHGTLATSFVPAVYTTWHWHPDKSQLATYDPDAANAALDEAGYERGPNGIRLDRDGKPIVLRLLGDNSSSDDKQMADYIIPWLKKIGIKVKLEMSDGDAIAADLSKANYDLYFTGWGMESDPDFQLGINTCSALPVKPNGEGGTSMDFWCNKKFDQLYAKQHSALDPKKRQQIVQQMQALHYHAAPSIDFWYADMLEAYRSDRFTHLTKQPEDGGSISGQTFYWAMYDATPVDQSSDQSGGPGAGLWAGIGVVVVVALGGLAALRRRRSAEDTE